MNWDLLAHAEEIAGAILVIGGAIAAVYFKFKNKKEKNGRNKKQ